MKNSIAIFNDKGTCIQDINDKPNDIFLSGNIIVTFGKKIEVFELSFNNNNNTLTKKREINNDNNNNNNNFSNSDNKSNNDNEILCIEYGKGFIVNQAKLDLIVCGHKSGFLSFWKPSPQKYLEIIQQIKFHEAQINKILCTQLSDGKNYLISCSSDKTVKIYSMEENKLMKIETLNDEVMDIKLVKNFNKQNIFIISLKNGELKVYNEQLCFLYDIPSRFKTSTIRYVLSLSNQSQNQDNNTGDLLLITEGKYIDVFEWIQEGSFHTNPNNGNNKAFKFQPNMMPMMPHLEKC